MRIKHNLILSVLFTSSMLVGCNVDNKPLLSTPITMLAPDKKEALTQPLTYDYSFKFFVGEEWDNWYFGTYSTPQQTLAISTTGTNNTAIEHNKVFSWAYQYPLGTTYGALVTKMTFKSSSIAYYSDYFGQTGFLWTSNTMNGAGWLTDLRLTNNSPFKIKIYIDNSSRGSSNSFYSIYDNATGVITDNIYSQYHIWNSAITLGSFYLMPFCSLTMVSIDTKLDALYFDVQTIPFELTAFGENYRDIGYGEGFVDGFESIDNLEWLENVATAVKDIFSVEILPGFTVGFIVLFPLVVAIVKWFLSLFGIGGGGS